MGALITTATRTPTALKRWSASNVDLPPVERIREIHVYDFDNTRKWTSCTSKRLAGRPDPLSVPQSDPESEDLGGPHAR